VTAAPLSYWRKGERPVLDWLPSIEGAVNVRLALKELLGTFMGA
jgi:hypothetical protein